MIMIGTSGRSRAICFCPSRAFRSGREITRQLGTSGRGWARNSCTDSNGWNLQPSRENSDFSDSCSDLSLVMRKTLGMPFELDRDPSFWPSINATFVRLPVNIPVVAAEAISHLKVSLFVSYRSYDWRYGQFQTICIRPQR